MKVKLVNLKDMVERETKDKYTPMPPVVVVIVNPKNGKAIISDNEACHEIYKDKYEFDVHDISKNAEGIKSFSLMSSGLMSISLEGLLQISSEEIELTEFVRRFGRRIEGNYGLLLKTIKQIGLNPKDFPRNWVESLVTELKPEFC